jgi:hypothetical protein
MFQGSKVRLVRGADNLTAIYEPIILESRQCEILNISQSYRPPRPVKGIAFYPKKKKEVKCTKLQL